jgi:long-chain acyl-CoA synthetase
MNNTPLPHKLSEFRNRSGLALCLFNKGQLTEIDWLEYARLISKTISALHKIGVKSGSHVAIHSENRFEWILLDLACLYLKAVSVPIYNNVLNDELLFILNDSKTEFLFSSHNSTTLEADIKNCETIKSLVLLETEKSDPRSWHQFLESGHESEINFSLLNPVSSDELATLVYTSGTTGQPKGVCLSHRQITSELSEAFDWAVSSQDRTHNFLPLSHILGRVELWAHVYHGFTMGLSEGPDSLRDELKIVKPTLMVSVPRIFEKFYESIQVRMESLGIKRHLFNWALDVGKKSVGYRLSQRKLPLDLATQYEVADRLVLKKIRDLFGGHLRFAISGGAPLSKDLAEFFYSCGVLILEGYGLSETTAAIFVNRDKNFKFGTVGHPIGDVKIKIADDGEILVKSDKVMLGYYNRQDETSQVFDEGWFKTGDIGEILDSGHLQITDRKKDLIKTSGGKYVAPQKLENFLKESPLIAESLVFGDQKKYVVAIIQASLELSSNLSQPELEEKIRLHVAAVNAKLASFETIKKFAIVRDVWSIESGELTPSLKVKRKFVAKKYLDLIEQLYL